MPIYLINKERVDIAASVPGDTPLLWILRDNLNLTGTKYGCGMAVCGACTVYLDGAPTRSCMTPLSALKPGVEITTIEGLKSKEATAVQAAWERLGVPQCGYCQSGSGSLKSCVNVAVPFDLALADKAGWPGDKRGRGVAVHESFDTVVAQVAEVTVDKDGKVTIDRVVCAVDCGLAVNPDVVRAQMEGGTGFGLSAAMYGQVTLKDGVVEQSNFHDYPELRINEMPAIEVHIVPSTAKPTGVGEPATPVIAPAVANAHAAATGKRIRTLPIALA